MELREKVINGLECCATNRLRREDCEAMDCVYLDLEWHGCIHQLIRDALVLLKEQEPVEPKKVNRYIDFDGEGHPYNPETYDCGACGNELPWKANYCPWCGRAVKWE